MKPFRVEVAEGGENVRMRAFLRGPLLGGVAADGSDVEALAVLVNFLRAKVGGALAVAAEDVAQRRGHLQRLVEVVERLAALGVLVVEGDLDELLAGLGVEAEELHAAVQEARAAAHEADDALLHEHAAVDRPDALELLEGHLAHVARRGMEPPDQRAVARAQGIDAAVHAAEDDAALELGRRRVHAGTRDEMPGFFARSRRRRRKTVWASTWETKSLPARDDRRAEAPAELDLPAAAHVLHERLVGVAAALRVVAIRRPVVGVGRFASSCRRPGPSPDALLPPGELEAGAWLWPRGRSCRRVSPPGSRRSCAVRRR